MFENFVLESVLEQPTEQRPEHITEVQTEVIDNSDVSGLEFEDISVEEPKEAEVSYTLADAEQNAELLVGVIASVNILTMTPLARWKVKKKRGGKHAIERMQAIAQKNFSGNELTDNEKRLLDQYNAYLADKQQLENAIPYTDDEIEALQTAAIPYCQSTKLKVNGGMAFWVQLGTMQLGRIMQILTV